MPDLDPFSPHSTRSRISLGVALSILLIVGAVLYATGNLQQVDTVLQACGRWMQTTYDTIALSMADTAARIAAWFSSHFRV